ncbi:MAG: hypothetical protein ACRD0D_15355, partial [Acidimicrobiales bacterium]
MVADLIQWGPERARAAPWKGDPHVAQLNPLCAAALVTDPFVRRCLRVLAERGYHRVLTPALTPAEQRAFLAAGFRTERHLCLLSLDLRQARAAGGAHPWIHVRNSRPADQAAVLALDHAAFAPFWR